MALNLHRADMYRWDLPFPASHDGLLSGIGWAKPSPHELHAPPTGPSSFYDEMPHFPNGYTIRLLPGNRAPTQQQDFLGPGIECSGTGDKSTGIEWHELQKPTLRSITPTQSQPIASWSPWRLAFPFYTPLSRFFRRHPNFNARAGRSRGRLLMTQLPSHECTSLIRHFLSNI